MKVTRHLLIGAVGGFMAFSAAHAADAVDKWSEGVGVATARAVADACISQALDGDDRLRCIGAPHAQCRAEHGRQTTIDLTDCIKVVDAAWLERLSEAAARIERRAPSAVVTRFRKSQRTWARWYVEDCRLQAEFAKGGTQYGLEVGWCELHQAGLRAIAIGQMADEWDR